METRPPPAHETLGQTVAASDAVLMRVQQVLFASQAMIDATRHVIRQSRQLITDTNALAVPVAHPVQSRQGFLPSELIFAM